VYLWSIQWDVLTKHVSSQRECNRWYALVIHVLGWCGLPFMRIVLYSTIKANHAHPPCMQAYSLCAFHSMHLLHKHLRTASYRIANREPSHRTRGAQGAARGTAARSDRSRRGGYWGTSGVPRSPPEFLRERQVPEHFLPRFVIIN
jgi:hypothetical protein